MCGRYSITFSGEELENEFDAKLTDDFYPNYNAAPSQNLPVITNDTPHKIELFRWGLVPHWAKDLNIGNKMINARSETILEKPSFKNAFKTQRCLVLADGYYEWKNENSQKTPYRIVLKDKNIFAFAGIWETWKSEDKIIKTFSIITTEANQYLHDIHNRMPVILEKEHIKPWLDKKLSIEDAYSLLKPQPSENFKAYEVSKKVNSPVNNIPELIKAV